jgi:tetratricopeptide (TPR) repeat protein
MGQGKVSAGLFEYARALEFAENSGDKIAIAMATVNSGVQNYLGGRLAEARTHLERGRQLFRESAGELRMINAIQHLGLVSLAEGDVEGARAQAELALDLATEQQDYWAADCHDLLGRISLLRGDYESARANFDVALRMRTAVGFRAAIVDSMLCIGTAMQLQGDRPAARVYFERAAATAASMDPCPQQVAASRHLGRLLLEEGQRDAAAQALMSALELAETMPETFEHAPALLAVAELSAQMGDTQAALARAEAAREASRTAEHTVESNTFLGGLLIQTGDLRRAETLILAAQQLAERLASPRLLGHAHWMVARLATAEGNRAAATDHYTVALHQFELARLPVESAALTRELKDAAG